MLSPCLLNVVLEALVKTIQQESEIESIALGNKEIKLFLHRDIILYGQNTKKSTERLLVNSWVGQGPRAVLGAERSRRPTVCPARMFPHGP